jgi:hypothetical protein
MRTTDVPRGRSVAIQEGGQVSEANRHQDGFRRTTGASHHVMAHDHKALMFFVCNWQKEGHQTFDAAQPPKGITIKSAHGTVTPHH